MIKFNSLQKLQEYLQKDRNESSLNPVRFINVESIETWIEVKKLLLSMSSSSLLLSEFCDTEDTMPNIRRLIAKMKASADSVCVMPISECLRINPEIAQSTILDILTKEYQEALNNPLLRIYIPMFGMRGVLYTIPDNDPRKKGSIILLESGEESDYSLTIIQKGLKVELSCNEIYGFKMYLRCWEQNPDTPLILYTSNAGYIKNNVFIDNVKVIVTAFDLMRSYYALPAQFQSTDGTEGDWNQLAQIVAKEKSFQDACCSELSINRYNVKLFENWKTSSSFQKWLLWMWTRLQPDSSYLTICAKEAASVEAFIEAIYCSIFNFIDKPFFDNIYSQRKDLMAKLKLQVPQAFWAVIDNMKHYNAIGVLTDLSAKERESIFQMIQGCDYGKKDEVITILQKVYPALAGYLSYNSQLEVSDFDVIHKDYFNKYRWHKATNSLSKEFFEKVKTIAEEQGASIYTLKARNFVVNEEYDSESAIFFIDGMGAEYIDYLAYVLDSMPKDKYTVRYRVGYCNLPSTTENNKDFLLGKNVLLEMLDLDQLKHASNQYPNNIIQEMALLDTLREKIEYAMDSGKSKIILTSDHGTSRLAVLVRKTEYDRKLPAHGRTIYKYGRYCEGTDIAHELPTAIEYDGKLIFADYTRFEQKGAPIDEIHGGASMEEWIVPVITIERISKKTEKKKIINKIILKDKEVKIDSSTKTVTITFSFEVPVTENVSILLHGIRTACEAYDGGYKFIYKPLDGETEATATIFAGNDEIGKAAFSIRRPLTTNKNFDI